MDYNWISVIHIVCSFLELAVTGDPRCAVVKKIFID